MDRGDGNDSRVLVFKWRVLCFAGFFQEFLYSKLGLAQTFSALLGEFHPPFEIFQRSLQRLVSVLLFFQFRFEFFECFFKLSDP